MAIIGFVLTTFLLGGCSVVGKWSLETLDPSAMRPDYRPHVLTIQKDHTYYADSPDLDVAAGTWQWTGPITSGALVLEPRVGEAETYKAQMRDNYTLVLQGDVNGEPVRATYKRKE
jgi:hypothetical protein